jgi:hypothetical protein
MARVDFDAVMAVMMLRWLGGTTTGTASWSLDVPMAVMHEAGRMAPWGSDRPRIEAGEEPKETP